MDNPRVSQYRLTAHLGPAVAIHAHMLWLAFELLTVPANTRTGYLRWGAARLCWWRCCT